MAGKHIKKANAKPRRGGKIQWYSPWDKPFAVVGLGWEDAARKYRRLPELEAGILPADVDELAWCPAGAQIRFRTDSKQVLVRVELRNPAEMDHMTAIGQAGVDAYVGETGAMVFAGVARMPHNATSYQATVCNFPTSDKRTITLNLPLYQGVRKIEIGLLAGSRAMRAKRPSRARRVVVYGTSITQGGCATRPGMVYTNILSRRLDAEFINLGFSGSGRGEPEVAETIATLRPPAIFVMDYEANCGDPEKMRATLAPFLSILRKRWPRTKILVLSRIRYAREAYDAEALAGRRERGAIQRGTVRQWKHAGDGNIYFKDGGHLLGKDFDECAVDGVHLTDLGFLRVANGLEKTISNLLS